MTVKNKQVANETTFNEAFLSRKEDTSTIGKVDLQNADSDEILDAQTVINTNIDDIAAHEIAITQNESDISDLSDDFNAHEHNGTDAPKVKATNLDSETSTNGQFLISDGDGTTSWSTVTGQLEYQGTWDADLNMPDLTTEAKQSGYYWVVDFDGSTNLDGITDWKVGDWAIYNGTVFQKIDNTDAVTSVAGRVGDVVIDADDVEATQTRYWDIRNEKNEVIDPDENDDSSANYSVGSTWFNSDTGILYVCQDNTVGAAVWIIASGSGGVGSPETIIVLKGDDGIDDWDITGSPTAVLSVNETTPLSGDSDFKMTNVTSSLNDVAWSPEIDVPLKSRNELLGINGAITGDGEIDDFKIYFYDVTNSVYLDTIYSDPSKTRFEVLGYGNSTTKIKIGFEVNQENNGTSIRFNDLEFKKVVYPQVEINNTTEWEDYTPVSQGIGTPTYTMAKWRRAGTNLEVLVDATLGAVDGSELQIGLPNSVQVLSGLSAHLITHTSRNTAQDNAYSVLITGGDSYINIGSRSAGSNSAYTPQSANAMYGTGEIIKFFASIPIEGWSAHTNSVVVASDNDDDIYSETQELFLTGDITEVNDGDVAEMKYSGLIVGERYRMGGQLLYGVQAGYVITRYRSEASGAGTVYGRSYMYNSATGTCSIPAGFEFTAVTTEVYFNVDCINAVATLFGANSREETFLQLKRADPVIQMVAVPNSKENESKYDILCYSQGANSWVFKAGHEAIESTSISGAIVTLNLKSGIYTATPHVQVTTINNSTVAINPMIASQSITQIVIDLRFATSSAGLVDFSIVITKAFPDYTPTGTYIGRFNPIKTMFIDTDATEYFDQVAGTTSYKTRPLLTLSGDVFGSISSDQLSIPSGKYKFRIPVGSYNAGGVGLEIYDAGNTIQLKEYSYVAYQSAATGWSWNTVTELFTFAEGMTIEFNTKGDGAGYEGVSRIEIIKLS